MPAGSSHNDPLPPGWLPLEDRLYHRRTVYPSMPWTLHPAQLASALVAAAPSAGPLALIPDSGWGLSFALAVYTLSGRLIARFDRLREKTVPPFRAVAVAWASADLLTIVYNDGVLIRLPAGIHLSNARLVRAFPAGVNERIHDAAILPEGHAVMRTASGKLVTVDIHDTIRPHAVPVPPSEALVRNVPNCAIAAVKTDDSEHATFDALVVTQDGNIITINPISHYTLTVEDEVSHIATSNNGLFVAAFDNNSGTLFVQTIDLKTQITRVNLLVELSLQGVENTHSEVMFNPKTPESITWVGNNAVALLYKEHLVLVGPRGGIAVLDLEESCASGGVTLHNEPDGLRIISSVAVQFVQMVPEPVNAVLRDPKSPGFKLLQCSGQQRSLDVSASNDALLRYRLLKELRDSNSLIEGARSCVSAAYLEMDAAFQKRLLRAATYGIRHHNAFQQIQKKDSEEGEEKSDTSNLLKGNASQRAARDVNIVPTAIAILRVVNAVGTSASGIPLTKPQFDALGLSSVVARLSRFGDHTLALRLAIFGGISPYDVLSEWASATIRSNSAETDEALTVLIADRFDSVSKSYVAVHANDFSNSRALPYVKAAEAAFVVGRPKCAELLLRRETRPAPKVAMYLRMGREGPAVVSAVSSGDPELVLDALGTILEKKSVRETARMLKSLPPTLGNRATDLLATHLKQIEDVNALHWLYIETERYREAALVNIHQINGIPNTPDYIAALQKAVMTITRGNGRRDCYFELQAFQHAANVAKCAMEVEKRGRLEVGTLRHASDGDLLARAIIDITDKTKRRDMLARLRRELRVPDRRFFWICLDSMAEVGDFESIEALSYSAGSGRAPPIGLSAFVDTCLKHDKEEEGVKYAMRMTDLRDRARALARCGRGREAAEIASRLRNQQLLEEVQDLAGRHVSRASMRTLRKNSRTSESSKKSGE